MNNSFQSNDIDTGLSHERQTCMAASIDIGIDLSKMPLLLDASTVGPLFHIMVPRPS